MTRKLLALAVAGALVAPIAAQADDSTVTLTGVVNGSIDFIKRGDNGESKPNIGTNATRFQIDGKEPLGNGWAAIFSLAVDQAFAGPNSISDSLNGKGLGNLENRNSFIGLAMPFGTLRVGQTEHQYEIQQILQDPYPAAENEWNALSHMTRYTQQGGSIATFNPLNNAGFTRRDPQSIWYTSPNWGGFILDLAYITGNGCKGGGDEACGLAANADPKGYQITGQYTMGSLTFYAGLAQYNDYDIAGGGNDKDRAVRFGVGWAAGALKLDVAGEQLKGTGGSEEAKNTNLYLGASFNIGNGQIRAQYAKQGDDKAGSFRPDGGDNISIGYGHALSKRTELFAYFGKRDRANVDVAKGVSIGARHSF